MENRGCQLQVGANPAAGFISMPLCVSTAGEVTACESVGSLLQGGSSERGSCSGLAEAEEAAETQQLRVRGQLRSSRSQLWD